MHIPILYSSFINGTTELKVLLNVQEPKISLCLANDQCILLLLFINHNPSILCQFYELLRYSLEQGSYPLKLLTNYLHM